MLFQESFELNVYANMSGKQKEGKENAAFDDDDGFPKMLTRNTLLSDMNRITEQFNFFREENVNKHHKESWSQRYESSLKTALPFRNIK